jgi:hypothetical protein
MRRTKRIAIASAGLLTASLLGGCFSGLPNGGGAPEIPEIDWCQFFPDAPSEVCGPSVVGTL